MIRVGKLISLCFFLLSYLFFTGSVCIGGELIQPTRILEGKGETTGKLTVVSEPSNLDVFLDGANIGKTPIWSRGLNAGIHSLRIKDSKSDIYVVEGKTLKVSLFKGSFITVLEEEKKLEKKPEPEQKKARMERKTSEPAKSEKRKDLSDWDRFIDGSSPTF